MYCILYYYIMYCIQYYIDIVLYYIFILLYFYFSYITAEVVVCNSVTKTLTFYKHKI